MDTKHFKALCKYVNYLVIVKYFDVKVAKLSVIGQTLSHLAIF